jgi:hypothetical protein
MYLTPIGPFRPSGSVPETRPVRDQVTEGLLPYCVWEEGPVAVVLLIDEEPSEKGTAILPFAKARAVT